MSFPLSQESKYVEDSQRAVSDISTNEIQESQESVEAEEVPEDDEEPSVALDDFKLPFSIIEAESEQEITAIEINIKNSASNEDEGIEETSTTTNPSSEKVSLSQSGAASTPSKEKREDWAGRTRAL